MFSLGVHKEQIFLIRFSIGFVIIVVYENFRQCAYTYIDLCEWDSSSMCFNRCFVLSVARLYIRKSCLHASYLRDIIKTWAVKWLWLLLPSLDEKFNKTLLSVKLCPQGNEFVNGKHLRLWCLWNMLFVHKHFSLLQYLLGCFGCVFLYYCLCNINASVLLNDVTFDYCLSVPRPLISLIGDVLLTKKISKGTDNKLVRLMSLFNLILYALAACL